MSQMFHSRRSMHIPNILFQGKCTCPKHSVTVQELFTDYTLSSHILKLHMLFQCLPTSFACILSLLALLLLVQEQLLCNKEHSKSSSSHAMMETCFWSTPNGVLMAQDSGWPVSVRLTDQPMTTGGTLGFEWEYELLCGVMAWCLVHQISRRWAQV